MKNKRLVIGIVYITIGFVLSVLSFMLVIDEWWQSFGIAIFIIGVLDLFRHRKYVRNPEYREKVDLSNNDERIRFLSMKAWSWAGYLFVLIAGLGVIIFQIAGLRELSLACSFCVCILMLLYWLCYVYLNKKY
jgi:uncharacterized membrane protein